MNKYIDKWILWLLLGVGVATSLLAGFGILWGGLTIVRLLTGSAMFLGSVFAVIGYYRMISTGPKIRLLTLFYLLKEMAIVLVALRLIHAAIVSLGFSDPASINLAISYFLLTLASFFIFSSGLYTLLGTIFDVFQLQVYKNPFKQRKDN